MRKIACFAKKRSLLSDPRVESMLASLGNEGITLYEAGDTLQPDTTMLLSIGGDGTFLSAALLAAGSGVPVLGVNLGRLGFLSGNMPDDVVRAIVSGDYSIENRTMLSLSCGSLKALALNEVSVSRIAASMLGVEVELDGRPLPTYWADGLLISTSSGSTGYSLSVGGPVCYPESRVLIVAPISPHNLNVRPLVVPESVKVRIRLKSRDSEVVLSADNTSHRIPSGSVIDVCAAPQPLGIVTLGQSNFIDALRSKLLWGEDVRNSTDF